MRISLLTILSFYFLTTVSGQDVAFTAATKSVVAVGEQFRFTYTLNAKGTDINTPGFVDFSVLSGPNQSSSSSVRIVNGQVSQNVTYTFTYILQAVKVGKFTIGAAKATVNGKSISSNAVTIEVVDGNNSAKTNTTQTNTQTTPQDVVSSEDLFVRVNVNKSTVYQGESIYADVKVYVRNLGLAGFESMSFPDFKGFWSQEIETPSQVTLNRENINGQVYEVGVLKKVLLFPQHSGEISIEPFELECVIRQKVKSNRRSIFDDFFGSYQNVKKKVVSPKVKIKVKSLPGNPPESYSGGVGSFGLTTEVDKYEVKANQAISMKVKLTGTGNLKLVEPPTIDFPPDFEVYDPKIVNNITILPSGASGNKLYEYLIIPRHSGSFKIPPVAFSYFDIASQSYKTITSNEISITVEKGDEEEGSTVISGVSKEDVRFIGSDIHYLKTGAIQLREKGYTLFGSLGFYLAYIISFSLFLTVLILRRKQIKRNSNTLLVKHRKASKVSMKRMKSAQVHLKGNNKELFYDAVLKALWGYMGDKLSIPVADLSRDQVMEELTKRKVDAETISSFQSLVDDCEFARFAPSTGNGQMDKVYNDAEMLINSLEGFFRS